MRGTRKLVESPRQPEAAPLEEEENEITHPTRTICSRKPHATVPRHPRARLSRRSDQETEIRLTPDWTEIGDPIH